MLTEVGLNFADQGYSHMSRRATKLFSTRLPVPNVDVSDNIDIDSSVYGDEPLHYTNSGETLLKLIFSSVISLQYMSTWIVGLCV